MKTCCLWWNIGQQHLISLWQILYRQAYTFSVGIGSTVQNWMDNPWWVCVQQAWGDPRAPCGGNWATKPSPWDTEPRHLIRLQVWTKMGLDCLVHTSASSCKVEKFLSSPRQNPDADVIQFWMENSKSYPRLAKVVRSCIGRPNLCSTHECLAFLFFSHHHT